MQLLDAQVGDGFNRDYWARFEKFVKDIVKRADDVYIVTGPVFAPQVTPQGVKSGHAYIGAPLHSLQHCYLLRHFLSQSCVSQIQLCGFCSLQRHFP
jgi:hypothetical protein